MTRKHVLAGCAVVSVVVVVCLVYLYLTFQGISPYNYGRIRLGMSLQDVEKIIGFPPGDHSTRKRIGGTFSSGNWGFEVYQEGDRELEEKVTDTSRRLMWAGNSYWIKLILDKDGKVVWKKLVKVG